MLFAQRLQTQRKLLQLTQEEVAHHLHVSQQTISSWENGRSYPDIDSLIQISDYYHISLDTLLKEDTGMKEEIKRIEVLHSLKPILFFMLLINLFLIGIIIWLRYGYQHTDFLYLGLVIVTIINSLDIIYLKAFIQNKIQKKPKIKIKWQLVLLTVFWIGTFLVFIFVRSYFYSGIATGITVGLTLFFIIDKKYFD